MGAEKRHARFQIGLEHRCPGMLVEIVEGGAVTIDDRDVVSPSQEKASVTPRPTRHVENGRLRWEAPRPPFDPS